MKRVQSYTSLNILWHYFLWDCNENSLSSPVVTTEFSKFDGTFSAALKQHYLLGFCQHPVDQRKSKEIPEEHLFLLHWLCWSLWLCGSQQTGKFLKKWEYQTLLKAGLKLNSQKTKIMTSGPITSWQIDGETMETVTNFIFLGSKITADGDCSHEIQRHLLLGRKAMTLP